MRSISKLGFPSIRYTVKRENQLRRCLNDIDTFVFDMQDVGCRIYTFAYTMANSMAAAGGLERRLLSVIGRIRSLAGRRR